MSARQERSARGHGRMDASNALDTQRSSPEDAYEGEGATERDLRRTRSQRREQDSQRSPKQLPEPDDAERDNDEDVTRCICRLAEYPGAPVGNDRNVNDGAFFIQCEKCNVWQHAGCVGFFDEDACPRHYYCETCRPDLHKIMTGKQGYPYSQYGRITGLAGPPTSAGKTSARDAEGRQLKDRDAKLSANANSLATAKRRATMNSRAAYDDEEVLRIIEESKRNGTGGESANGSRKSKRTREESEESEHEQKRRKTGSESGSAPDEEAVVDEAESGGEEAKARGRAALAAKRAKQPPYAAVADKDPRRRERDREQDRVDATNRRKGRSERRRGDDADGVEDSGKATSPSKLPSTKLAKAGSTKQAALVAANPQSKRSSKVASRRGKVGRNQYTKDRDNGEIRAAEARPSHSRDGEEGGGFGDGQTALLPNGSRPAKQKHLNPNRTSMNELRKRAAGILEFISRTQIEMAGDKPASEGNSPPSAQAAGVSAGSAGSSSSSSVKGMPNGSSKLANEIRSDVGADEGVTAVTMENTNAGTDSRPKMEDEDFKGLDTLNMMDVLSREIHHWQQMHGKWGSASREIV